jgi:hypothetical protein
MDERETELFQGMANCYNTCHEDFKNTVHMVARARGLSDSEVIAMLQGIKAKEGNSKEYIAIRSRLPKEFPI